MNKGKLLLTGLLLVASLLSGVLLFTIPTSSSNSITELDELYEQIDIAIEEAGLQTNQFRKASIEIDSTYSRSVYRINVPPSVSKTSFPLAHHHQLIEHEIYSPAKNTYPEENMDIHVVYKNTVCRTIRLSTTESIQDSEDNG